MNLFMLCGNKMSYILKKTCRCGKSSNSTKSEVFLKHFFNKFEDIGK